eukprot:TRINITY_DN38408_c0_g1_i2.p1 TRINITY_DN38408_c0_g1~~TRINITY_DN38408_c0_g1_i2.p1  ORF type:complete len:891 (-),score=188.14 TRINITY_DN38408_c0_g1_i2:6-2678(-)
MSEVVSDAELEAHFKAGLHGHKPRPHQTDAVARLLQAISDGAERRWLVQHAPGSGKTETILLLAFESLRCGLVDRAVVLNYADALESQFVARGTVFLDGLSAVHKVPIEALTRGDLDLSEKKGGIISCLLQKFRKKWTVDPLSDRTLVICDEAHVGIPEEGTYVKNAEAAFGQSRMTVLFTATPKSETLQLYGIMGGGQYMKPFHVYTQRDAIGKNAMLSPLEKYESAVPKVPVDGVRLLDTAMSSLGDFLERVHERRNTTAVRRAWAEHILSRLPLIADDMPVMKEKRHRQKSVVVVETIDEVVAMTTELRLQIKQKTLKNSFGQLLHVSCFYTGSVEEIGTDFKANGSRQDAEALELADLIVLCRKYTTGWDEWRVCGIFICRRLTSPEFLMQLLGRATRVKPGSGKKLPYVVDFANDPTWIFESAARFFEESRLYTSAIGRDDLQEQVARIKDLLGTEVEAHAFTAARRLKRADQATLMAAVLRHLRLQRDCRLLKGLPEDFLRNLLRELNKAMADSLWGGSLNLAERAVKDAIQYGQSRADLFPGGGTTPRASASGLNMLLRPLRRLLRSNGTRRAVATPARGCKRPRSNNHDADDGFEQEMEVLSSEKRAATIKGVLDNAVRITSERFQTQLSKTEFSPAVCALREKYVNDLRFRLGSFFLPEQADDKAIAESAIGELQSRVDAAASDYMRNFLMEQADLQLWNFKAVIEAVRKAVPMSGLPLVPEMFSKVKHEAAMVYKPISQMLGGLPGEQFQSMYEGQLEDYVRSVCKRESDSAQSRSVRQQMRAVQRHIVSEFQQQLALDPSLGSKAKLPRCIEECVAQFVCQTANLPGTAGGIGHAAALKLSWRLSVVARNVGSADPGDGLRTFADDSTSDADSEGGGPQ